MAIKLVDLLINEEMQLRFKFPSRKDFLAMRSILSNAKFRDNSSGNPPTGKEVGTVKYDDMWNVITILKNEKLALKLIKKSKINYTIERKPASKYVVINHGGYLD